MNKDQIKLGFMIGVGLLLLGLLLGLLRAVVAKVR